MLPQRKFYFIRHGQTDWNAQGLMQGHTDIPLNETGKQQAQQAAEKLRRCGITRILTSPLTRALQTAAIIADVLEAPIIVEKGLKERNFGSYEGKNGLELKQQHGLEPEDSISKILPADAEQWPETKLRVATAVAHQLKHYPTEVMLMVSHGGMFRALYEGVGGPRTEAKNATPYLFMPMGNTWGLEKLD